MMPAHLWYGRHGRSRCHGRKCHSLRCHSLWRDGCHCSLCPCCLHTQCHAMSHCACSPSHGHPCMKRCCGRSHPHACSHARECLAHGSSHAHLQARQPSLINTFSNLRLVQHILAHYTQLCPSAYVPKNDCWRNKLQICYASKTCRSVCHSWSSRLSRLCSCTLQSIGALAASCRH